VEGNPVTKVFESERPDQVEVLVEPGIVAGLLQLVDPPSVYPGGAALEAAGEDEAAVGLELAECGDGRRSVGEEGVDA
jgi:hypothetical protein